MQGINELKNSQRVAFDNLMKVKIPEIISNGSKDISSTFSISCSMFPVNYEDIKSTDGTEYYPIKMKCALDNKKTQEHIEFNVDLLDMPAFQELGFKINGNYMQVLDSYDKMTGWLFYQDKDSGEDSPSAKATVSAKFGKKFRFVDKNGPAVRFISKGNKSNSEFEIPVSMFFRALTGMSKSELLAKFGASNPYVITAFSDSNYRGKNSKKENSRNDCIEALAKIVLGETNAKAMSSTKLKLNAIERELLSKSHFNLGEYNHEHFESIQSYKHRAAGKLLAETIRIGKDVYETGTVLTNEILEIIDASPITNLKIEHEGKIFNLKKYSTLTFRAYGMYLAKDVPEVGLKAGKVLDLDDLNVLNKSNVAEIAVSHNKSSEVITMTRRTDASALTVDDLFTGFSMWMDNLNGLNIFDKEYELSNRVCVPFDVTASDIIQSSVNKVVQKIESTLMSDDTSVMHAITDFEIDTSEFIKRVKDTKISNSQMSDMCNIVAFTSKSNKIATKIDTNRAGGDMTSVQDTQEGRLDPYDSPESAKIGVVHHKTLLAGTDDTGYITTPYLVVRNGKVTSDEPVMVSAADAAGKNIAMWNETFQNEDGSRKEKIRVLCDGEVTTVDVDKVHYKEYSNLQSMSLAHALVTFPGHSNGKRITMSCNQQKQAVTTVSPERPLVGTGCESIVDFGTYLGKDILDTYYQSHANANNEYAKYRNEIMSSDITLQSIQEMDDTRVLSFTVDNITKLKKSRLDDKISITVPYNMRNFEQSSFSYVINHKNSKKYGPDEVVAYNSGYSLKGSERVDLIDYGKFDVSDKDFNRGLALGKNFLCGYKTYESGSIDDAISISDSLFFDDTLTHKRFMLISDSCHSDDTFVEEFGVKDIDNPEYFDVKGIPVVGTKLKPGDRVISKIRRGQNGIDVRYKNLESNMEGQVISSYIEKDRGGEEVAKVILVVRAGIQPGDKLAGRHGNKGTIAKIVPAECMPFDPVLGRPLDIVLNPLGVPSRQNLSQLMEIAVGLCRFLDGKQTYVSAYHKDDLKFVKDQIEQFDVHPRMLIDGRTGQYFKRPVNVGVIYMYKLQHISAAKIHSIGMEAPVDPVFLQPKKGSKNNGGQSFGEMENWCLHGVGCFNILHDLYGYQSDDVDARAAYKRTVKRNGGESPREVNTINNNDVTFQSFLRLMGVELLTNSEDGCYELTPMTDSRIRALATTPVETKDGLHNTMIFGKTGSNSDKNHSKHLWGYIELGTEIIHPQWVKKDSIFKNIKIKKNKDTTCSLSQVIMEGIIAGDIYVNIPEGASGNYYEVFSKDNSKGFIPLAEADVIDRTRLQTGMQALVYVIRHCDPVAMEEEFKKDIESKGAFTAGSRSLLKKYNTVRGFNESGQTPSDYIITTFPVLPQSFRPTIKVSNDGRAVSDFDHFYEQILVAARNVRDSNTTQNAKILYDKICDLITSSADSAKTNKEKFKGVMEYFVGKGDKTHGKIRSAVQSKRVFCSGRAVISPARYSISPLQLGVPVEMLIKMYETHLIAYFRSMAVSSDKISDSVWKKILLQIALNSYEGFEKIYSDSSNNLVNVYSMTAPVAFNKMKNWLMCFFGDKDPDGNAKEPQVVLAGRQPSLHKYSIRGFYPVPIWSKAIEINSLVCKGYNADFDGDQMWVTGMMSAAAREEAIEKLSPKVDFINPKNSSIMLEHTQDISLGCYCATMLKNNEEQYSGSIADAYYYNAEHQLEQDVMDGIIEPWDLVVFTFTTDVDEVHRYVSTAGRILFNSIFEDGFTDEPFDNPLRLTGIDESRFNKLKYDGVITSGKGGDGPLVYYNLQEICKQLYLDADDAKSAGEDCINYYYEIQKFGFKFSDMISVSLSLEDLDIESNKKAILEEVNKKRLLIEQDAQNGLIAEDDKKDAILSLYTSNEFGANKKIEDNLIANLPRNNNLFIMIDSGARGNKAQLMHMCGAIGVLEKTKLENMSDSITSNYYEGLDSFDVHMASYSSRTGVASTQRETRDAGYSTRKVVYMTDGFKIRESDCGKENWWYDIIWQDSDGRLDELSSFEPSQEWFSKNLDGKELVKCNREVATNNGVLDAKSFTDLQNGGFNSITIVDNGVEKVFKAEPDILLGATVNENDATNTKLFKYLLNENGELTTEAIRTFDDYKVMHIATSYGNLECRYAIDKACRSELMYREAKDLKHLRKIFNRSTGEYVNVITKETLDYIEREGIQQIQARVMLDCKTKNGVCAHCYGLKYSNLQLPDVGEVVGTEAAQAIGEPAAQLTMNVVNKGGAAGSSIASGVRMFNSYLDGGVIGGAKADLASVPAVSGYARIDKMDNAATVSIEPEDKSCAMCQACMANANGGKCCPLDNLMSNADPACMFRTKIPNDKLIVRDGEWVDSGYPVTAYPLVANSIVSVKDSTNPVFVLRRRQMIWLLNYFNIFDSSNISINARHFEILVIVQNQYALVTWSKNPSFKVGEYYRMNDLLEAGDSVSYHMETANKKDTILRNSGLLASLTFAEQQEIISRTTMSGYMSSFETNNSPLGMISVGQDLDPNAEMRVLDNPISLNQFSDDGYKRVEEEYGVPKVKQFSESSGFDLTNSMEAFDLGSFDSDDIFASLDEPIEESKPEIEKIVSTPESAPVIVEEKPVEEPKSRETGTSSMDIFGSSSKEPEEKPVEVAEKEPEEPSDVVRCTVLYYLDGILQDECTTNINAKIGSELVSDESVISSPCIPAPDSPSSLVVREDKTEYEFYFLTDFSMLEDSDDFEDFDDFSESEDSDEMEDDFGSVADSDYDDFAAPKRPSTESSTLNAF